MYLNLGIFWLSQNRVYSEVTRFFLVGSPSLIVDLGLRSFTSSRFLEACLFAYNFFYPYEGYDYLRGLKGSGCISYFLTLYLFVELDERSVSVDFL